MPTSHVTRQWASVCQEDVLAFKDGAFSNCHKKGQQEQSQTRRENKWESCLVNKEAEN